MKNTIIFISAAIATFTLVLLGGFVIYLNFLKKGTNEKELDVTSKSKNWLSRLNDSIDD